MALFIRVSYSMELHNQDYGSNEFILIKWQMQGMLLLIKTINQ